MDKINENNSWWNEVGIVDETYFEKLIYNHLTNTIIAYFSRKCNVCYLHSLYKRKADEKIYRKISSVSQTLDYTSPITSPFCQYIFFNLFSISKFRDDINSIEDEKVNIGVGMDWVSISKIDLNTDEQSEVINESKLLSSNGWENAFVSEILNIWVDGKGATCIIGIFGGTENGYHISELEFESGKAKLITLLPTSLI